MATTASGVTVPAPVETVWATLARFADISRWARAVDQSSLLTAGPPGTGTTRRVQVGRAALRETVDIWEPERRLGYTIEGLPAVVTAAHNTWVLRPEGAGTAVELTGEVETRRPVPARLVAVRLGRTNDQLVADLAARVARRQA